MYGKIALGMFNEIDTANKAGAMIASLTLTYVCIDAMTYLSIPLGRKEQNRHNFIEWVNKYLKTDPAQPYQYDGNDVYAARCGQLHTYSPDSTFGGKQNCKKFGYHDGSEHAYNPAESPILVMISVKRLINDFYAAVDAFFQEAIKNPELKKNIDSRIQQLYQQFQFGQ